MLAALSDAGKIYSEEELLTASSHIIVLAEPGAGKSELMKSLARKKGTRALEANGFCYRKNLEPGGPLVIDGFDELAKINMSGIHALLAKVEEINPSSVIVSSRSSEWSESATIKFANCLGAEPLVVRLCEFSHEEQRALFLHRHPDEDFEAFVRDVHRFGLGMLLANPQFLDMLAAAYTEDGRHFSSRDTLFSQSVKYQASERNIEVVTGPDVLSLEQTIAISSAIFAKLLLSGAEGVALTQPVSDRIYPYLYSLAEAAPSPKGVLASRLFKPGSRADQHRPVHKIIAEYCAAVYLCERIADPADPLTLRKCLSIIAPGQYVRDELRGLLGWMAASNTAVQHDIIRTDPYAVLANGDPSRLTHSARLLLIDQLERMEERDPFFRRSDAWRRFSVTGFFTPEIMNAVRAILTRPGEGHLRDLLLELLDGAPAVASVTDLLSSLLQDNSVSRNTRWLAGTCLLSLREYDFAQDLSALIQEVTPGSLRLASEIIAVRGSTSYTCDDISGFLRACARLYPGHSENQITYTNDHYFIRPFIHNLLPDAIAPLLDLLSEDLTCTCHKQRYECDCRNGISKIIGSLLDRYVLVFPPPYDPVRLWNWIKNLNFHSAIQAERSDAVRVLQQDDSLRRGIYRYALNSVTDEKQIRALINDFFKFPIYSHSGLCFAQGDREYVLKMAFEEGNTAIWLSLFPYYSRHARHPAKQSDPLRQLCRQHANTSPRFMQAWGRAERSMKASWQPDRKVARKNRRSTRQREAIRIANLRFYAENRNEILNTERWDVIDRFASVWLSEPGKIPELFGDEAMVKQSLINCLSRISVRVPSLRELARFNMDNQTYSARRAFFAASLLLLERDHDLSQIDPVLLRTLRIHSQDGYSGKDQDVCAALTAEIDRLIFPDGEGTEDFLREYLEPQLVQGIQHPPLELITRHSIFTPILGRLAVEWLGNIQTLTLRATQVLFRIACEQNATEALKETISRRCATCQAEWPERTDDTAREEIRMFWLIRAFYFLPEFPLDYWQWITADRENLSRIESISGRLNRGEKDVWSALSPTMIRDILRGFTEYWYPTGSPVEYNEEDQRDKDSRRFLHDIVYGFSTTDPTVAIPVIRELIGDDRMRPFLLDLKSVLAGLERDRMFRDYAPPSPQDITAMLDKDEVVTVEGLRETILFHLEEYQQHVRHSEFNALNRFYPGGTHLGEEASTDIITEWLSSRLQPRGISVIKEHEVHDEKRADFSATRMLGGKRLLLMAEVKGQWNKGLYTAAEEQLYKRYSNTPDAGLQGIYIALWFGKQEKVAGLKGHGIESAAHLKETITANLPDELRKQIDIFVLDLAR